MKERRIVMKPCLATIFLSVSIVSFLIPVEGFCEPMRSNMKTEPIFEKNRWIIDKNIESEVTKMTSQVDRVIFLTRVITNNQDNNPESNCKKATALRLMGDCGGTNAISVLIENLEYEDAKQHDKPAVASLITIGELAVQPLLRVVSESKDKHRISLAVQALMAIKRERYNVFVDEHKGHMNDDAWKNLLRYAIED